MVKNKRRIKKSIQSFERRIEEHKQKIRYYSGEEDYLKAYWEKEIENFEKQKKKEQERLQKK